LHKKNLAHHHQQGIGEKEMRVFRNDKRFGYFLAVIFGAGMFVGGCAATINYSYDPVADFSMGKNYSWASGMSRNRPDVLIEKNVRYYADQSLKDKGFTLTSDKPDFLISMNYESEYSDPYKVRVLNLYVYRAQSQELIWQGTAAGTIDADAASPDLAEAVKKILAKFPPKR
jgi:Domain of unknown function (DUF4136)